MIKINQGRFGEGANNNPSEMADSVDRERAKTSHISNLNEHQTDVASSAEESTSNGFPLANDTFGLQHSNDAVIASRAAGGSGGPSHSRYSILGRIRR